MFPAMMRRLMEKLMLQAGAEIARRGERQSLTNTIQSKFKTNLPIVATARKSFATYFGTLKQFISEQSCE